MRALIILLALGTDSACSSSNPCMGVVGDTSQPIELEITYRDASGNIEAMTDGARVPLVQPPQGGKVIFASVRAKNLDTCQVIQIIGSVRDGSGAGDLIIGLDGRPLDLVAGEDGWAVPREPLQISSYANIPVCPNHASSRDIYEQEYYLTVSVRDGADRRGSKTLRVVPFCGEAEYRATCLCTCAKGYELGSVCPQDAPDAGQ